MLSKEMNERLTQVGPGTPGGELLRRYWQAVCPKDEITEANPKKRIRILGEDLLLYRTPDGRIVCTEEHCAHRRASLFFGFIEEDGIRCCYHGWKYNSEGKCIERPYEPREVVEICMRTYPIEELGGLLFVYMGPDLAKAPPLPKWDVLARNDGKRSIVIMPTHDCNWLQIQENTIDSVHTYYLHGHMSAVKNLPTMDMGRYFYRPIVGYDFGISEWGIDKSITYGGDRPEVEVRPPLIFPNVLRIPEAQIEALHFRIPIDDTHTRIIWCGFRPGAEHSVKGEIVKYTYEPERPMGWGDEDLATFYGQDRVVWETQGAIVDRSKEHLGASDRGIMMFRKMLAEQIQRVAEGKDPTVAVVKPENRDKIIVFENASKPYSDTDHHNFV
jgi:5,5'-dehydrodivanillate O-demethylase